MHVVAPTFERLNSMFAGIRVHLQLTTVAAVIPTRELARDVLDVLNACSLALCASQTDDDVLHPTDITLPWAECDSFFCDYTEVSTIVTVTCAGDVGYMLFHCCCVEFFCETV